MAEGTGRRMLVSENVYQELKRRIMSLELAPGTVMSTKEMAERLEVSRTPVREAFIRLGEEHLVDIVPQKETAVSRIEVSRVKQERFIRQSLELPVLMICRERMTAADLGPLHQLIEQQRLCRSQGRSADFVQNDNLLHRQFFLIAGQPLAFDTLQSVNGHDLRFRLLVSRNEEVMEGVISQHERLIQLILTGEADALRAEFLDHLHKMDDELQTVRTLHPDYFK